MLCMSKKYKSDNIDGVVLQIKPWLNLDPKLDNSNVFVKLNGTWSHSRQMYNRYQ